MRLAPHEAACATSSHSIEFSEQLFHAIEGFAEASFVLSVDGIGATANGDEKCNYRTSLIPQESPWKIKLKDKEGTDRRTDRNENDFVAPFEAIEIIQ